MKFGSVNLCGYEMRVVRLSAAVVGSGAAGYRAATELYDNGVRDIAVITEARGAGTSRNTGSDKQTYYKLSLCGDSGDSPVGMARDLFACGCTDGDTALAEAANSAASFLRLCGLGVPFPVDRYGQFAGYKTDHDPRARATSAGPLTSKFMTEVLERAVYDREIPVLDGLQVISVLRCGGRAAGLVAIDKNALRDRNKRFVLIEAPDIIFATGGPACIYADSVYPNSQTGGSGVLAEAGIRFQNMTEWQYGMASLAPRWNVSGTYMQVLPRFVSVDKEGREFFFLEERFGYPETLDKTFLKGYEWPFDSKKLPGGSSLVDLLVHEERVKHGRRVYLDYRVNPFGSAETDFSGMCAEGREYLEACGACFGTPAERLLHMNLPAYELYRDKGVDIREERLEIAVCAQHHNGGAAVDIWWQTSLRGLYAVGEVAGTHGITRPGGSALNAGQVGAVRAAKFISAKPNERAAPEEFERAASMYAKNALCAPQPKDGESVYALTGTLQRRMSEIAGIVRDVAKIREELIQTLSLIKDFDSLIMSGSEEELPDMFKLKDNLMSRALLLFALSDYSGRGLGSRGSAVYSPQCGEKSGNAGDLIQEVFYREGGFESEWRGVRPIPADADSFENIWRTFRENGNVL